jgi:hypothetical protein
VRQFILVVLAACGGFIGRFPEAILHANVFRVNVELRPQGNRTKDGKKKFFFEKKNQKTFAL